MLSRLLLPTALFILVLTSPSWGVTGRDLSQRMVPDGFTVEFAPDERIFGFNEVLQEDEESVNDSRWGVNNDINQIRITWDARNLYLAGEGCVWDNNMILFLDSQTDRGLDRMTDLNSWRRNFFFDTTGASLGIGFAPDLFAATWDRNTEGPHLIMQERLQTVRDFKITDGIHSGNSTFDQASGGRSIEVAIPWRSVFLGPVGFGTRDTVVNFEGVVDTVSLLPRGAKLRIAGVVTTGADALGGPDSAPDNTRGHSTEASEAVFIDNWAIIDLDRQGDLGQGEGPDGIADWGVEPRSRVTFRFRPPIDPLSLRFGIGEIQVDRPALRPDLGERSRFSLVIDPAPDPENEFHQIYTLQISVNVFDLRGRFIRNLVLSQTRRLLQPNRPDTDVWDGRDEQGRVVPPGVYILRAVLEPNISRGTRAIVVVR